MLFRVSPWIEAFLIRIELGNNDKTIINYVISNERSGIERLGEEKTYAQSLRALQYRISFLTGATHFCEFEMTWFYFTYRKNICLKN
jgi:hypothetical protein